MERPINIHEAKTHLSRLIERVEAGEEITLARAGRPVARLVPYRPRSEPRLPGLWKGRVAIGADFDEPLRTSNERSTGDPTDRRPRPPVVACR